MGWIKNISQVPRDWIAGEDGVAVMEAAMLLPVMMVLLMGVYDLGNGITLSARTVSSSQIAADLVSRNRAVDSVEVEDIIQGAKLAFEPYAPTGFGIDVASIRFDVDGNPEILWRETRDMLPNDQAVASVAGLAEEGEGMIIVTVRYSYQPMFSKFFTGPLDFSEVAFARGRRSPTVTWGG